MVNHGRNGRQFNDGIEFNNWEAIPVVYSTLSFELGIVVGL
jgi:hypothetical protein